MINKKFIYFCRSCVLVLPLFLISCSDQGEKSEVATQQGFESGNFQATSEADLLKARLFDNSADFDALSRLGDIYFESTDYIEALKFYDKALAVNPQSADCLNDRGLALFYTGNTTSALDSFKKATSADPNFTHAWLSLGFVLVSEGRFQEAIAPLNKVKELDGTGYLAKEADNLLAQVELRGGS